ncbi:MAG: 2Fe-2S iron-sulfur cluster binding domain-containing protein [Clostridiales bacterium]|nr:2Fe-2S iron-sulfur cluster binding domain-containing protein [Clostridiales bacterium]
MVNLKIDGVNVSVNEGATILQAAASVGIRIPTLCYYKDLNEIGACRVCVVEVKGENKLCAACNSKVYEGMEVFTNSPKARETRRINVELVLSEHDCKCATCVRSGNCALQEIANDLGITDINYETKLENKPWDMEFPLIRDSKKCIKCMRCVQVCDHMQGLNIWDVFGTGSRTTVGTDFENMKHNCSLCGQCITHCPVGALRERDDVKKAYDALADKEKITVVQVAPAVRTAWAEALDVPSKIATEKRMVAAIRKLGFNYVFDTNFSADLTIMEEGSEFIERLTKGGTLPMFTSCCPGWVRFVKSQYPELTKNLSTAKSPQQMFGAVAKSYYAQILGVSPDKICSVSIMPCTAKKHEADIPVMNDAGAGQDVDIVLTTRELARMIKADRINVYGLEEEDFDQPLGTYTGAGVIFGATGGVMEAALRSAHFLVTGKNPEADAFADVRGMDGWKERTFTIGEVKVRTAVASGLANARKLIEAIKAGKVEYDFVEIMACPGGCVGGGGQPIHDGFSMAEDRAANLYALDKANALRFSHENPAVKDLYDSFMEKPLSHKSHELLHTDHDAWNI